MTHASSPSIPATWSEVTRAVTNAPASARIGVAIRDHTTDTWFEHNGTDVFRAASTVKLLILLGLGGAIAEGRTTLAARLAITEEHSVAGSGVLHWLDSASPLSVHDLAWLMIAISDNTASNVLMDHVGLHRIHELQSALALQGTELNRHFMKPVPGQAGNVATARDLIVVLDAIASHPTQSGWMTTMLADQQVTDRLARFLPESVHFAGKSGWQTGISHDAGIFSSDIGGATVAVLTEAFDDPYQAAEFIGQVGLAVVRDLGLDNPVGTPEGGAS